MYYHKFWFAGHSGSAGAGRLHRAPARGCRPSASTTFSFTSTSLPCDGGERWPSSTSQWCRKSKNRLLPIREGEKCGSREDLMTWERLDATFTRLAGHSIHMLDGLHAGYNGGAGPEDKSMLVLHGVWRRSEPCCDLCSFCYSTGVNPQ